MTAGQKHVSESEWAPARVKLLTCKEWRKDIKKMFTEAAGEKTLNSETDRMEKPQGGTSTLSSRISECALNS